VILHDISGMSKGDQHRLRDWIEVNGGRSHVVSTSAQPLVPLIESGTFLEPLYYRLNIICVGLGEIALS
jgi:transcriptional regulator of acetoin/glycerol metabolism